jgi:hypothetical protein
VLPTLIEQNDQSIVIPENSLYKNYFPKYGPVDETSVFFTNQNKVKQLEEKYEFSNIEEIRKFIMQNGYLIDILYEAPENIYRVFGRENIKLVLELERDPEEGWDELFIVIKSLYNAKEAVELERKLFDEWFVHIMDKVNNKLNFTEEPYGF